MARQGIDLAAEWRSRRWRRLLNVIDGLPSDSALAEAQAQDDELAAMMLTESAPDSSPRVSEFGPTVRLLTDLVEAVHDLTATTIAAAGQKPRRPRPLPRPETAWQRAERRQAEAMYDSLMADLEAARRQSGRGDALGE